MNNERGMWIWVLRLCLEPSFFVCFSLLWLCDANFTDVGRMCLMEAITFVSIRVSSNVTNDPEKHEQPLEWWWIWVKRDLGLSFIRNSIRTKRMTQKSHVTGAKRVQLIIGFEQHVQGRQPKKQQQIFVFNSDMTGITGKVSHFRNVIWSAKAEEKNNKQQQQNIKYKSNQSMKSPVDSGERDRELSLNVNIRAGGHEASWNPLIFQTWNSYNAKHFCSFFPIFFLRKRIFRQRNSVKRLLHASFFLSRAAS